MKPRILTIAFALLALTTAASAAESIQARGILVAASNEKRESDKQIAQYVPTLRRILRFESYRYLGSGSGRATEGSATSISIGQGQHLVVELIGVEGNQVRASVKWTDGDRTLMKTVLVMKRGGHAVIGGPPRGGGDEVLAVILIAS